VLSHVEDCSIYMACRAVTGDAIRGDEAFSDSSRIATLNSNESRIWLLGETENDAMGKLSTYAKELGPLLRAREPSHFMKVTLGIASRLGKEKKVYCLPFEAFLTAAVSTSKQECSSAD